MRKINRKEHTEGTRVIKEKFLINAHEYLVDKAIYPMNQRQTEYFDALRSKKLVIATGYAGTSKTFVATSLAADAYKKGEISKIVLARPAMSESKSLGFNKGDLNEKMRQWVLPMLSVLNDRLGVAVVNLAIDAGNIVLQPLESIKGMSYGKECWVICDEVEDCTIKEIKSIVTRNGGCRMTLCGDITQSTLSEKSGLSLFKKIIEDNPKLSNEVALIDFDEYEHIVRSRLCKDLIVAFDKSGH